MFDEKGEKIFKKLTDEYPSHSPARVSPLCPVGELLTYYNA